MTQLQSIGKLLYYFLKDLNQKMSGTTQAPPGILASSRLMTAEAEEALQRPPVSCGLSAIDDLALDGGFRYGEITSIAGATATGKTLVCFSLFLGLRKNLE